MSTLASAGDKEMQGPSGNEPGQPASQEVLVRGKFEVAGKERQAVVLDVTEKALVQSMDAISTQEVQNFVSKIEAIQGGEVLSMLSSLFDFMGFDPIQIIKKLIAVNRYYRETKGMSDETEETLKIDVMMMVSANIIMGNLQVKSIGRRSNKGRAALEYLVSKYQMKIGSTGAGLPSDVLTFPRVANSFPVLTCRSAQVLPMKQLPISPFGAKGIPREMRVGPFATFCPEELESRTRMFLLKAVCAYSCDHMVTVAAGERKKRKSKEVSDFGPEDAWAAQWDFILVSSSSPVPEMKTKRAMMTEFRLENAYSSLIDVIKKVHELVKLDDAIPSEEEYQKDIQAFISGS